jgi:hypothetical protein
VARHWKEWSEPARAMDGAISHIASFIRGRFGLDVGIHGLVLNWGVNTKTEDNSK